MEEIRSDNPMVRSIYRILFQNELPYRNELFRYWLPTYFYFIKYETKYKKRNEKSGH